MNAKEKANELFNRFNKEGMPQISKVINRHIRKEMIKQCALIAVDEIIKANPHLWIQKTVNYDGYAKTYDEEVMNKEWWQEVKQEIEKL